VTLNEISVRTLPKANIAGKTGLLQTVSICAQNLNLIYRVEEDR
jgi:hypothetical protein